VGKRANHRFIAVEQATSNLVWTSQAGADDDIRAISLNPSEYIGCAHSAHAPSIRVDHGCHMGPLPLKQAHRLSD
jgi:hypothetical protein